MLTSQLKHGLSHGAAAAQPDRGRHANPTQIKSLALTLVCSLVCDSVDGVDVVTEASSGRKVASRSRAAVPIARASSPKSPKSPTMVATGVVVDKHESVIDATGRQGLPPNANELDQYDYSDRMAASHCRRPPHGCQPLPSPSLRAPA